MLKMLTCVLLLAAQLNSGTTLQTAPQPALPKIDENACPFEGCQFGTWTARQSVALYSTWKSDRKVLLTIGKGQTITALTGIHITFDPGEIEVTAPIPEYGLKPGDRVFQYMNLGEGFFNAWFNGYWIKEFDGSGVQYPEQDSGCTRNCSAIARKMGRFEWWVKVQTQDGTIGWTKDSDQFAGTDSLGGSE